MVIPWWTPAKILRGSIAFGIGAAIIYFGLRLLGVRVELFTGISYFNFSWFTAVFLVPALSGLLLSSFYGLGGKILAYFPPGPIFAFDYYTSLHHLSQLPVGSQLMPLGWWGFFVILAIESSAIGGVFGEVLNKRIYGRSGDGYAADTEED